MGGEAEGVRRTDATDGAEAVRRLKVTGGKVYASDFRPRDLAAEGWPAECAHALLLRSRCVDRPFTGLDLGLLPPGLRPDTVVTAADLPEPPYRNRVSTDRVQALLPVGERADYLGQPVAIALYGDFVRFRRAAQELREDPGPVLYGPRAGQDDGRTIEDELRDWTRRRFTGTQRQSHYLLDRTRPDGYSFWQRGRTTFDGTSFVRNDMPDTEAEDLYRAVEADMADGAEHVVETTTFTQQTDPAFLEPEAGLAWLDRATGLLHMLLGTQSPHSDVPDILDLLGDGHPTVRGVRLTATECGGGFGGRDKSPFPFYLALAAVFSPVPVRLAYDRREQFQGGLKRHESAVRSWIRATPDGRLHAVRSFVVLRGGVEANLNGAVLGLAALHATGPYRVPRASVHAIVLERAIPPVGSMRGFGIPQVAFNLETALDRLAVRRLRTDPIRFRLANVLRPHGDGMPDDGTPGDGTPGDGTPGDGDVDLAGTPLRFHVGNAEVCAAALEHPLWRERDAARARAADRGDGTLRGVGFACCMEAYGTSQDSVYSAVRLTEDGRAEVWGQTIDMGQSARLALEHAAHGVLGVPAVARLGVVGPFERFARRLRDRNLHSTVKISLSHGASSASKTAFFHVHVLREVCLALLRLRILPAARTLLGDPGLTDAQLLAAWRDGAVRLPGRDPVPLAALAGELRRTGGETYALAHGYFCNGWSGATFRVDGVEHRAAVDALALGQGVTDDPLPLEPHGPLRAPPARGPGGLVVPRSLYAAAGHLIGVELSPRRGTLRVTDAVTFLDAGDALLPSALEGQVEGGLAMGISHALHEELPEETGAGPFVNLDRYRLARYADITGIRRETVLVPLPDGGVLGPGQPAMRHKGVGEATMTGVGPAIANAVAHALGHTDDRCWPTRTPIRLADLPLPTDGRP
ncbi:xanthine dehydrogenase family protein molybdopterin-binding subunit [Streptomyces sp. NPDC016309]|uniref:xanthine dehydrogenase family protein molybdopterin-binding subunit n=1 Tax=Streptomyces sp. NPDC016309 TaxID=3364965 RepID=UPI0036F6E4F1